jgi:hypothetical protein
MNGGNSFFIGNQMVVVPDVVPKIAPFTPIGIAPFIKPDNIVFPSLSNGFLKARQYFNPNDDPELHRSVVEHFYKKLREIWLDSSMEKLLRYIKVENGNAFIVHNHGDFEKNNTTSDRQKKIDYILDRVFSKYDLEMLLTKLAIEYSLNWYDMKNTHNDFIKRSIYRKIKHRLSRHF